KLVVTDTVSGPARIEQVIQTLDVPSSRDTVRKIIPLESADASWVVSIIKLTISGDEAATALDITADRPTGDRRGRDRRGRVGSDNNASREVVAISGEAGPVLLVPEVTRNWIIAVAPSRTM